MKLNLKIKHERMMKNYVKKNKSQNSIVLAAYTLLTYSIVLSF